jgi:TonB family protein
MLQRLAIILALLGISMAGAAEAPLKQIVPAQIGRRTVVLQFALNEKNQPAAVEIVSSEAEGLNIWTRALVESGQVKIDAPGVTKIGDKQYRISISCPVEDDGPPLPPEITAPVARVQAPPSYPYDLARSGTSGGALLRLTIDEQARIQNVELVRASHKEFGRVAVNAVKKWRFAQPAKKNGQPMAITLFQLMTFEFIGAEIAPWQWQVGPEPALPIFNVTGERIR